MLHRETVHILGATPKDTEIGQSICLKKGLISKAMHVSSNPAKQAVLHTYDIPELEDKVIDLILQNNARELIVFCNSLSFSLDWINFFLRMCLLIINFFWNLLTLK